MVNRKYLILILVCLCSLEAEAQIFTATESRLLTEEEQQLFILDNNRDMVGTMSRSDLSGLMTIHLADRDIELDNPLNQLIISRDGSRIISFGGDFRVCKPASVDLHVYDESGTMLKQWKSAVLPPYAFTIDDEANVYFLGQCPNPDLTGKQQLMKFDGNGNFRWARILETNKIPTHLELSPDSQTLLAAFISPEIEAMGSELHAFDREGRLLQQYHNPQTVQHLEFVNPERFVLLTADKWQIRNVQTYFQVFAEGHLGGYPLGYSSISKLVEEQVFFLFAADVHGAGYHMQAIDYQTGELIMSRSFEGIVYRQPYRLISKREGTLRMILDHAQEFDLVFTK